MSRETRQEMSRRRRRVVAEEEEESRYKIANCKSVAEQVITRQKIKPRASRKDHSCSAVVKPATYPAARKIYRKKTVS